METEARKERRVSRRYLNVLSPREALVFAHVVQGETSKEIAQTLFIEEKTVKFHLTNIYKKTAIKNRAQLISGWFTRSLREEVIAPVHAILPTHVEAMRLEKLRSVLPVGTP